MSDVITKLTDDNFEKEVLQSTLPVLVDFWADWCGPCKMIAPTIEAVALEFKGKAKFGKLNVDENTKTPTTYDIRGIPTLILFKGGKIIATKVGALSKGQLTDFLNANI